MKDIQKHFPVFSFDHYEWKSTKEGLVCTFYFSCGDHTFAPTLTIGGTDTSDIEKVGKERMEAWVFHLGLAEIPSYWKAFCSPTIRVCGYLSDNQKKFWQKLIFHGMGEFFYVNRMEPFQPLLVGSPLHRPVTITSTFKDNTVLVPVGGGKDSVVTLELLAQAGKRIYTFYSREGQTPDVVTVFSSRHRLEGQIHALRTIDSHLLELNSQGHPNGHTPFSSVLAFLTTCTAELLGIPFVALSNERSASEPTGTWYGIDVNHQYSKSLVFENDFRAYIQASFPSAPEYFSFLRPLYELQIMKIFTQYPEYFESFRSCNVGQKTNTWCGKCPKCTFVALILSAFVDDEVVTHIFNKNILDDTSLIPIVDELIGKREFKPFECVGTIEESKAALTLAIQRREGKRLPGLLEHYKQDRYEDIHPDTLLQSFATEHNLPGEFSEIVRNAL